MLLDFASYFTPLAGQIVRVQQHSLERLTHKRQDITLLGALPAAANASALRAEAEALFAQPVPELRASVAASISVVPASAEQPGCVVAARDFEAGTLVVPVFGYTATHNEAARLQRASTGKQKSTYMFATPVTKQVTLGLGALVVCAAPALSRIDVASPGYELPGNIAIVAAMGAGRCGSHVVKSYNNDYLSCFTDLRLPLLLCVATRRIQTGDALLFESDTEFWQSTRAGHEELPDVQHEVCWEHDSGIGAHVGNQSPRYGAGTARAASEECPPAPQKRPRGSDEDADSKRVRPCRAAAQACVTERDALEQPAFTAQEVADKAARMVSLLLGRAPPGAGFASKQLRRACQ